MNGAEGTIVYHGSFPGFLCACAEALNSREPAPRVLDARVEPTLFEARFQVARDDERAAALWDRISNRAGSQAMVTVLEAFLSGMPGADASLATVLRKLWRKGAKALNDLSDGDVLAVEKAALRARQEGHKFCGLVRFSKLSDGSWYAPVEPSCDVLPLIAEHFSTRFSSMRFAIHDLARGSAIIHEAGRPCSLVEGFHLDAATTQDGGRPDPEAELSRGEKEIRALWSLYFRAIAIEPRRNRRLQMSHMPRKYWSRLTEMGPD